MFRSELFPPRSTSLCSTRTKGTDFGCAFVRTPTQSNFGVNSEIFKLESNRLLFEATELSLNKCGFGTILSRQGLLPNDSAHRSLSIFDDPIT